MAGSHKKNNFFAASLGYPSFDQHSFSIIRTGVGGGDSGFFRLRIRVYEIFTKIIIRIII